MSQKPSISDVAGQAQEAFWAVVAQQFPHIKTGDFPPDAQFEFDQACRQAVKSWVRTNETPNHTVFQVWSSRLADYEVMDSREHFEDPVEAEQRLRGLLGDLCDGRTWSWEQCKFEVENEAEYSALRIVDPEGVLVQVGVEKATPEHKQRLVKAANDLRNDYRIEDQSGPKL